MSNKLKPSELTDLHQSCLDYTSLKRKIAELEDLPVKTVSFSSSGNHDYNSRSTVFYEHVYLIKRNIILTLTGKLDAMKQALENLNIDISEL